MAMLRVNELALNVDYFVALYRRAVEESPGQPFEVIMLPGERLGVSEDEAAELLRQIDAMLAADRKVNGGTIVESLGKRKGKRKGPPTGGTSASGS